MKEENYGAVQVIFDDYNYCEKIILEGESHPGLFYREEIEYIVRALGENKEKRLLEWGCGGSTFIFSQYAKNLVSIESSDRWFSSVEKTLKKANIKNVELRRESKEYTSIINKDEKFDVVFIDGINRQNCLNALIEYDKIHDESLIFFHDCVKYKINLSHLGLEIIDIVKVFWKPEPGGSHGVDHMAVIKMKSSIKR